MGRQIDTKNVVGRDELISRIWEMLRRPPEQGSLRFTAERRVGKTTVMTKMAADHPEDFDVLFLEVEGISTCQSFAELLLNRMRPFLQKKEKAQKWFVDFLTGLRGTEIAGVIKLPETNDLGWQTIFLKAIDGFCQNREDRTILIMLDELPYMLQKIEQVSSKAGKPHEALTLVDTLRALRQSHRNLRMIFAGSVGLHHVLRDLKQDKLASQPFNNMELVEIKPLNEEHALILATELAKTQILKIEAKNRKEILKRIVELSSRVPFYIERIISRLGLLGRSITVADVDDLVQEHLTSDRDPWEMDHFRSRLVTYYAGSLIDANGKTIPEHQIARAVLDHFACTEDPQTIEQVWQIIRGQYPLTDRKIIVDMLKFLAQDHYLETDSQKQYSFRFPLIKRWWKIAQGLES